MRIQYFITGTDTGVGKTFATCALLHRLREEGLRAVGYKPVAAGAQPHEGGWANEDALALQAAGSEGVTLERINPVCLRKAIAPHIAAAHQGVHIDIDVLAAGYLALREEADAVLVEGAGGFLVPLSHGADTGDLVQRLALPVIMVVGLRLGCLNHALLTAEAIRSRGLELAGWIANCIDPAMPSREDNLATLHERLGAPLLGTLPWMETPDAHVAAQYLRLPRW